MSIQQSTNVTLLRLPQVERKTGFKKSKIYQMLAASEFPAPVRLGSRCVAWRSDEVDQWINELSRSARWGGEDYE